MCDGEVILKIRRREGERSMEKTKTRPSMVCKKDDNQRRGWRLKRGKASRVITPRSRPACLAYLAQIRGYGHWPREQSRASLDQPAHPMRLGAKMRLASSLAHSSRAQKRCGLQSLDVPRHAGTLACLAMARLGSSSGDVEAEMTAKSTIR